VNPPLELRSLFADALRLPMQERAALAAELLASLRPSGVLHEEDADFATEVERRAERVRSGESEGLDWDDVLRELSAT
jgi:putative addiction module component (TIGR02574 family)